MLTALLVKTLDTLVTFFPHYNKWRGSRHQKFVNNVLHKLNTEYEPDLKPKFGPVFRRHTWKEQFLRRANLNMYLCYYGASDLGKSLAISQSLKGRRGVIYLPLRNATREKISHIFATQIGYFGNEIIDKEVPFVEFQIAFKEACQQFQVQNKGTKIIVFTDDIDSHLSENGDSLNSYVSDLPLYFVDLYNQGLVNNVYAVSDYRAISILKRLSGHSTRLRCELFPSIPDHELKKDLNELSYEMQHKELSITPTAITLSMINSFPPSFAWNFNIDNLINDTLNNKDAKFVLDHSESADLLIQSIGSHIGSLIEALQMVVMDNKSVEEAINSIVAQEIPIINSHLSGVVEVEQMQMDRDLFLVVVWKIFEELSSHQNKESINWNNILIDHFPNIKITELKKIINFLVSSNLLSYTSTGDGVCFNRKVLKAGFKLQSSEPYLTQVREEALKNFLERSKSF